MRSSKSRSRSKANRPRTLGNIINRVFDSSGPEGKVRGTPQQIIEKYQMLAGDAQRSNDRVAAENFSQHAEHYTRMLAEAQREMAAEQEQRQQSQQGQQGQQPHQNGNGGNRNERVDYRNDRNDMRNERSDQGDGDQPYTSGFAVVGEADNSLVDLPEVQRPQQQPRRDDQRREPRADAQPRRNENRRDDRPREERPRENRGENTRVEQPRAEQPRAEQPRVEQPRVEASQPETPRFESPAQLVAQVEKSASTPARARAPKVVEEGSEVVKTTRAPRARKPKPEDKPEAAE